jgi:putative membrane protein
MRVGLLLAFCAVPLAVSAHGTHEASGSSVSPWDAAVVAALIGSGALYALGQRRIAGRRAPRRRVERAAFWTGWAVMLGAVVPPLDQLAGVRLSAHMLQHELLMIVGVPLIVSGRPLAMWLWGLPVTLRTRAAHLLQRASVRGAWRILSAPVVAWAGHGVSVWVWHVPRLYDLAVRHEVVHALQHAIFVGGAALFWSALVCGRYGRAGYGASVFYIFTTAVHTGILGATLTLAGEPLYPVYRGRVPDALADQQLAGLVMWVPAGIVLTIAGLSLFAAWLAESDRRSSAHSIAASSRSHPQSCASARSQSSMSAPSAPPRASYMS